MMIRHPNDPLHRVLLPLLLIIMVAPLAHADMLISPTRGMLSDKNRSETLTLRNTSDGPRTYRLSWEDKRAVGVARYEPIEEGESWNSAADLIRFSPRQITVGPGENQTVRLSYRPPEDLAPGEYRSHLRLQVISEESEPTGEMNVDVDEDGIGVRIFMQMSFSVPVVVRHEVEPPAVSITDVEVLPAEENRSRRLAVTLERKGEASSYGRLLVEMQRDADSPVEVIGRVGQLSIFHEQDQQRVRVPLRDENIPAGAWVRVVYEGQEEYSDRVWDERVFQSE